MSNETMRAVEISEYGGPEVLRLVDRPRPVPGPGELLIQVQTAGLNNADMIQRAGRYPQPPGSSDIPGLEVAGRVAAVASGVEGWSVGDPVCALLAGGGYAEYAAVSAGQCLRVPAGITIVEAAALPEALFTCWTTLVDDGGLRAGQRLLVHGGSSGIGTIAIAMAASLGATVYATAGSGEKCEACLLMGAEIAVNYKEEDFEAALQDRPIDIVLDMVGGDYVARSLRLLAPKGRYVGIGLLSNEMNATIPMGLVISRHLIVTGSTLRQRSTDEKAKIRELLETHIIPFVAERKIKPLVHRTYSLSEAAQAHRDMEAGGHIGKLILQIE